MNSALPHTSQPVASLAARSQISGVLPMASITEGEGAGGAHRRSVAHGPPARKLIGSRR